MALPYLPEHSSLGRFVVGRLIRKENREVVVLRNCIDISQLHRGERKMNKVMADRLANLIKEGAEYQTSRGLEIWSAKVDAFLRASLGAAAGKSFMQLCSYSSDEITHALRVGHLEGLLAQAESLMSEASNSSGGVHSRPLAPESAVDSRKISVVHGHDNEAKETTARFLEKLKLEPIILHEQPSGGSTIIEKFEMYSGEVGFAVILLTPDDVGSTAEDTSNLRKRARQNVIMELGYFMGKLG